MEFNGTKFAPHPGTSILVPHKPPVGVQCGFCPEIIWKHKEAGGRLFMHKGIPICARCRILKNSRFSGQIRADKGKYQKDLVNKEKVAEQNEIMRVAEIAVESQKRAMSDSDRKKALKKKLNQ